jgi:predicted nucleotidyltransferase
MHPRYSDSLRRALDRVAEENPSFTLGDELRSLTIDLISRHRPLSIVLAGSLAEGRWIKGLSDIDILIVAEGVRGSTSSGRFELRAIQGVDVNIAIYTPEEVVAGIKSLNFFIIEAIYHGIPLFGEEIFEGFVKVLEEEANRMGLVRREGGWSFQIRT